MVANELCIEHKCGKVHVEMIVNIIKAERSKLLSFLSSLFNQALFCQADTEDNGDNQE